MAVYLDADCALNGLISAGFMESKIWKKENVTMYRETFYRSNGKKTIIFQITVENDVHKISAHYIENLERQYKVNLSIIANRCAINEP
jgi:hypothetical protein